MSKKVAKKIVYANWKMNPLSLKEAEKLFVSSAKSVSNIKKTEIVVCPPVIYLGFLKAISYKLKATLGVQNISTEESGAHTGEISAEMVYGLGGRYVILGHSERRTMGETNEDVNKKIKRALSSGLVPILCVGEKERDENHEYLNFIKTQVEECLKGISRISISKIIIAYEPIWAIGKNAAREATPAEFLEMKIFIKKIFSAIFGVKIEAPRIIYGGSVDVKNTEDFIKMGEADGFLVGRASLDAKKFSQIINITEKFS
jgi:triosephosphate isomerase